MWWGGDERWGRSGGLMGAYVYTNYSRGWVVEEVRGDYRCSSWLLLPAENLWSEALRTTLYIIALLYLFLGIAIVSDVFMCSIEVRTGRRGGGGVEGRGGERGGERSGERRGEEWREEGRGGERRGEEGWGDDGRGGERRGEEVRGGERRGEEGRRGERGGERRGEEGRGEEGWRGTVECRMNINERMESRTNE